MATLKSREEEKKQILEEEKKETRIQPSKDGWIERYYEVIFNEKSNPNDTNEVQLTVNGECLQIKRGIPVVVPQRFLEVAQHTKYPQYEQLPDKPRKITSYITTYPYTQVREATEKEFVDMREAGNAVARRQRERMEGDGGI